MSASTRADAVRTLRPEIVDLLLQNAAKPHSKPRRQELQRQLRPAWFGFGLAHGVPFTPFLVLRKLTRTFSKCPVSLRFSPIPFWHQTRGAT
jgi:hypothetical protein